jgi:5-carboxymethyl-2-hydroxymuconate isomerase
MPHLTLDYTRNLTDFDAGSALRRLNAVLAETGHFDEIDIKSRAVPHDCFVIGVSPENRAFIHAKLAIMNTRSAEVRSMVSKTLLRELHRMFPYASDLNVQLCVEIIEIEQETYAKAVIGPASV